MKVYAHLGETIKPFYSVKAHLAIPHILEL